MPFAPGQSGNPGGRPKKIPAWVAKFRRLEPKILAEIEKIIQDPEVPVAVRLKAFEIALGYSRGKPRQAVELGGPDGEPLKIGAEVVFVYPSNGREVTPEKT